MFAGRRAPVQIGIGLLQGLALHFVLEAHPGPAARPIVAALLSILVFAPCAINLALPAVKLRRGLIWSVVMCLVLGGIACYRAWVFPPDERLLTNILVLFGSAPQVSFELLFIAQALLLAGTRDGKFIASYDAYFDVAWGQAVQIVLGLAFTALLYGIVFLGAELFSIIGLDGLKTFLGHRWVYLPLITTGFAVSVVITEQRVQLLRTSRSLFLALAAWLLPFLAALTLAFLLALPVTGLAPLWATHRAGGVMIFAAFLLVLLINAVYGDGTGATASGRVLRGFASLACVLLLPIVALAAYGAARRIGEHGLTPARIFLCVDILVIGIYAIGYPLALIRRAPGWLHGLRAANLAAAFAIIGLILLLWSPVVDPTRISVADQMTRLHDGRVTPEQFDYDFLRFSAGRYGAAALQRLKSGWTGPGATTVAAKATDALARKFRGLGQAAELAMPPQALADARRKRITVHPAGAQLPADLLSATFERSDTSIPNCLQMAFNCEAVLIDVLKQSRPQVLFITGYPKALMSQAGPGAPWRTVATMAGNTNCPKVLDALRSGNISTVPAAFDDLEVAGALFTLVAPQGGDCRP